MRNEKPVQHDFKKFFLFYVENVNTIAHKISNTLAHRSFLADRIATKDRALNYIILRQLSHTIIKKEKTICFEKGFLFIETMPPNKFLYIHFSSAAALHGISIRIFPMSTYIVFIRHSRWSFHWHLTDWIILDSCPNQ